MEQFIIIPILIVIASGLIYVFGFKKAQEPKFKKIAESSSGNSNRSASQKSNNTNRKKEKSVTQNSEKKSEKIKTDSSSSTNNKKKANEPVVQKQDQQTVNQSAKKSAETIKSAAKSAKKSKSKNADKAKQDVSAADQPKVQNDDDGWFEVVNKKNKKNDESKNDKTKEKQQVSPAKSPVKGLKKDDKTQKSNKQNLGKSPKTIKNDTKNVKTDVQTNNVSKPQAPVIVEVVDSVSQSADYDKENQSQNNQISVKANIVEPSTTAPIPVHQKDAISETVENVVTETKTSAGIVFDELGESWTEAKAPKKSKKKVRKD